MIFPASPGPRRGRAGGLGLTPGHRGLRPGLPWLLLFLAIGAGALGTGCTELRGRRKIREGNQLYRDGKYDDAVAAYTEAQRFVPGFWLLWFNKGLACRQQMIPGSHQPGTERATDCALEAFQNAKRLKSADSRFESLYVQTLFDADRFKELAAHYEERLQTHPNDGVAMSGLIQVYTRWNRLDEALHWYQKRAALQEKEAEAQYAVGVFLWSQLFQKGGGPEMAAYNPLENQPPPPEAAGKKKKKHKKGRHAKEEEPPPPAIKPPPPATIGDLTGATRVRLADLGISYLEKALALRPHYPEAMTYLGLLYRQKSFGLFADPEAYKAALASAEAWRKKATEALTGAGK